MLWVLKRCSCIARRSFSVYKEADLFDFINAPVGKGLPITKTLHPLIAGARSSRIPSYVFLRVLLPVPTTAGTGSETTGTAILDITSMSFKTGIANRAMKPMLGIVDTLNTRTCSRGARPQPSTSMNIPTDEG